VKVWAYNEDGQWQAKGRIVGTRSTKHLPRLKKLHGSKYVSR